MLLFRTMQGNGVEDDRRVGGGVNRCQLPRDDNLKKNIAVLNTCT